MGSCFGRLLGEADGDENGQAQQQVSNSSQNQRRSRRQHRNQAQQGLANPSGGQDDDVPLLNDSGTDDQSTLASGSRRHRRRQHRHTSSRSNNHQNHLQYFTGASTSGGGPGSLDSNADIKLAQRVGLIQQLPLIRYDEERKQIARECVICMVEFDTGDMLRCLPCLHTFHEQCIDQWLLKSLTCPSCMEPVDAALLATFATGWSN